VTAGARPARRLLAAGIALGVILRVAAIWTAPDLGYLPDHLDGVAWGSWARTHGPSAIYDMEPELVPLHQVAIDPNTRRPANYFVFAPHAFNYPPFSALVYWVRGVLWHALGPDVRIIPVPPSLRELYASRGLPMTVEFPTINTRLARAIDAVPSTVFDVALALGVAALVRTLARAHQGSLAPASGFALVFASPVVILDATYWGQSDSWITSMLVWCLVWWLRGRWIAAGAAYGLALLTKPQAILFAPVLAYAVLALRYRRGGSWRQVSRALWAVPAALVVVAAVAAPFMAHDARVGAGAWRWVARGYLDPITTQDYAYTTLNAFNLWWLDFVATRPSAADWWRLLDSRAPSLIGLSKDATGTVLLVLSIGIGVVLCARRLRWGAASRVAFAFAVLLSAFLLPTRVHERYVYYCIPFLTALVVVDPRSWRGPFVVMTLVGTAEMLSHLLVSPAPASFAVTGAAALAAVGVLPWTWGVLALAPAMEEEAETGAAAPW
jgi:hypothetical protein